MGATERQRDESSGRFAYDGLERAIHEKARLGILTSLVSRPEGLLFSELKDLCALTDGNLSRHLKVLQEAGLVDVQKGYEHNRPQTVCRITEAGQIRFQEYLNVLEQVIADAAEMPQRSAKELRQGWSPA